MFFKNILLVICTFFWMNCFAQDHLEKKDRLTDHVTERFHVLKSDENIKDGLYQAVYRRKTAVASGNYTNGKKTGLWYFYNTKGLVIQTYNYSKDMLQYEAREDSTSNFRYLIDKVITDTDRVTKPIKPGGRYYGYLPYLGLFKTPFDPYQYSTEGYVAVIELLVSPLGNLADYKVYLASEWTNDYNQTVHMSINLLKKEDRKFIPATFNGEPIQSRVVIKCRLDRDGGLVFY